MRQANDFYETNAGAVMALRRRVEIKDRVLEPCAGNGAIARCFEDCHVITNDADPDRSADFHYDAAELPSQYWVQDMPQTWIVTNPPFSGAFPILRAFVEAGFHCAFLLRLTFLEPTAERGPWLERNPPEGMIVLPRYSFDGSGRTDSVTCAWMLWHIGVELTPSIQIATKEEIASYGRPPQV